MKSSAAGCDSLSVMANSSIQFHETRSGNRLPDASSRLFWQPKRHTPGELGSFALQHTSSNPQDLVATAPRQYSAHQQHVLECVEVGVKQHRIAQVGPKGVEDRA